MESVSVVSNERKRYVMHISSPEGHEHMVSPLTTESSKEILERLFSEAEEIEIKENGAQGDGFFVRIEPLAEYVKNFLMAKTKIILFENWSDLAGQTAR